MKKLLVISSIMLSSQVFANDVYRFEFDNCINVEHNRISNEESIEERQFPEFLQYFPLQEHTKYLIDLDVYNLSNFVGYDRRGIVEDKTEFEFHKNMYRSVTFSISANPNYVNSEEYQIYSGMCFSNNEHNYSEIYKRLNAIQKHTKATLEMKRNKYILEITT